MFLQLDRTISSLFLPLDCTMFSLIHEGEGEDANNPKEELWLL